MNTNSIHPADQRVLSVMKLQNFNDMQYFIDLYIGSRLQELTFLIDTGSSVIIH